MQWPPNKSWVWILRYDVDRHFYRSNFEYLVLTKSEICQTAFQLEISNNQKWQQNEGNQQRFQIYN